MADKRRLEPSDTDDGTDGAIVEVKKARTGDALAVTHARKSAAVPSVSSLAPIETRPKIPRVQ